MPIGREHEVKAYVFRQRASQAEAKANREGIPDATRRAWLIVAREWVKMAEREETKTESVEGSAE